MNGRRFFKKSMLLVGMLVVSTMVLAACSPVATPVVSEVVPTEVPMPVDIEPGITIQVADSSLGKILVDGNGMTLYMFTKDEPNKSNCEGGCLEAWPPFLAVDNPVVGEGVDAGLLGTTTLADGKVMVTYNQMPLYYWVNDKAPGDTTGQDVNQVWYVVSPDGKPVGMPAASADVLLKVASNATLGEFLVDGKGMTLYMYTKDEPNKSNCTGSCLENWPPLLAVDSPAVGDGVDASLLGSADLADGSKIVTYNGMPLYYWVNDMEPGQTTGQDVGGVCYLVSPAGEVIK